MKKNYLLFPLLLLFVACQTESYKFAVLCDTRSNAAHNGKNGVNIAAVKAVCTHLKESGAEFVLAPGDFICGNVIWYNEAKNPPSNTDQYQAFIDAIQSVGVVLPNQDNGITLYPVRGNHECYCNLLSKKQVDSIWMKSIGRSLPVNGPKGEIGYTYSFKHKNCLFLAIDQYMHIKDSPKKGITMNLKWFEKEIKKNSGIDHVFAFGHTPAFSAHHKDCLAEDSLVRNQFIATLSKHSDVYFCGHDHFYARAQVPVYQENGKINKHIQQIITPSGAPFLGDFKPKWNGKYQNDSVIAEKYLDNTIGYQLVTVTGNKVDVQFIGTTDGAEYTINEEGKYNYTYKENWKEWKFEILDHFTYQQN